MNKTVLCFCLVMLPLLSTTHLAAHEAVVVIDRPMAPPAWALLERELLRANTAACEEFFAKYFDERGYLQCVVRWGADDGPDDAIENVNDWPILYALGAPDNVLQMVKKAWEGHLRQYTEAKTTDVPFARDGMYFKEFPVMCDWLHNGEGLTVFNLLGLSDPNDLNFQKRTRRYAGFYMNEDPGAPNYDAEHRIIRSMFNGSRGPLMRKATALDWAGDPIDVEGRFIPLHGERNYQEMLDHFKDYTDIIGDHPQNLSATTLALNAYMLTGEAKYKKWLLEYVDAWVERTHSNGGIIPSNIGLDGTIGGACEGKWYGGTYGWGFSVEVPQSGEIAHRNTHGLGLIGFMNAFMLTGDVKYLDVWRQMITTINSSKKVIRGETMYPTMFGDDGWYAFTPAKYNQGAREIDFLAGSRGGEHRVQAGETADLQADPGELAEQALTAGIRTIQSRVQAMRKDPLTPDTRLSDDPMQYNPATVQPLIEWMLGGIHPGHRGAVLHCMVRYFDPVRRRAGVPPDVAALVEHKTADQVAITLVNCHQTESRTVLVQTGGYAEHQCQSVAMSEQTTPVDHPDFTVRLDAGCGGRLVIQLDRYANQPTMKFPWDR